MKRPLLLLPLFAFAALPCLALDHATNNVPRRKLVLHSEIPEGFSYAPMNSCVDPIVCRFGGSPVESDDIGNEESDLAPPFVPLLSVGIYPPVQIGSKDATVYGISLSLPCERYAGVIGIDAGIVNDVGFLGGVQIGGVNFAEEVMGLQIGIVNFADEILGGVQIGLFNRSQNVSGMQIGLINSCHRDLEGVQIGLINTAYDPFGVQIGLLNLTTILNHGAQIGGVNTELNENCVVLPFINATF